MEEQPLMFPRMRTALLALVLVLTGASARAADSPTAQADALIGEGFKLRLQGKNAEALDLFLKAHAVAPSAKTLGQMGSVEVALRRWIDAEAHLEQALTRHDSPWIEIPKNRELIEKTLAEARQQIGRVQFRGPVGASVAVDGRPIGALPLIAPVHLAAGSVRVTASAAGFQPLQRDVSVQGGADQAVDLTLLPVSTLPAPAPAVTLAQPAEPGGRSVGWRAWTGGGLLVAGLAGVGVGIGWLVVDGRPMCDAPPGGLCKYLYDTKAQGWAAVGVGAAVAGVGAAFLLWPSKHQSIGVGVGPGSVALRGGF
jgi:hypothetical protein